MAHLSLSFLGSFQATLDGEPVTGFESNKVRALLAYLAVEGDRPHRRHALAGLLWPDWPDRAALRNLSYALANLREALGDRQAQPSFLIVTRQSIQFNPASDFWLDVVVFSQLVTASESRLAGKIGAAEEPKTFQSDLQSALNLYHGDFLGGFIIGDSVPFEEWALLKREQLHRQVLSALSRLARVLTEQGDFEVAQAYARRQVELEPWNEAAHEQLMRILALSGQRSGALMQYETCRRLMAQELGVEPSQETVELYEQIRDGVFPLAIEEGVSPGLLPQPPAPGEPPFKGLQYFDETDADLFFGREQLTARLVGNLCEMLTSARLAKAAEASTAWRFLAVVGASGSGKSSLLRAGLVPALRRGEPLVNGRLPPRGSEFWPIHILTPTAHPLESLAASLTRQAESVSATASLMDDLAREPRSLHLYAHRLLPPRPSPPPYQEQVDGEPSHLLLVVDQFEELFTLCRDEAERSAFIANLLVAAGLPAVGPENSGQPAVCEAGPVIVVIALRADFYPHCAQYDRLRQALSARQDYIGPMDAEELRRAVEEPARRNGWDFEPELVGLILRDAGGEPGALPLLSHALLETWQRRSARTMTIQGYTSAGGVRGAIARTAETVYRQLAPEEQVIARRIFLRLTELGEGTQDTRRRVALSELIPGDDGAPLMRAVLKVLADSRLVTLSRETAEVAHEALIREWPALREWLNEDRQGLLLHRHLTEAALAWDGLHRDPGELYRGARLAQALEWMETAQHAEALNPLEKEFLDASREYAERAAADREAQRQRELVAAQKLAAEQRQRAEEQAQSAGRLRRRAVLLIGALVLAIAMASVAVFFGRQANLAADHNAALALQNAANARLAQTQKAMAQAASTQALAEVHTRATAEAFAQLQRDLANRQALSATSRELALAAINNLEIDPERSILLALQALSVAQTKEAENALHWAVQKSRLRMTLGISGQSPEIWSLAFHPDGSRLVSSHKDGTVRTWDALSGLELFSLPKQDGEVNRVVFSPDGARLATAGTDGTARIWDNASGKELLAIHHQGPVWDAKFSPDGSLLGTSSDVSQMEKIVSLWDALTGQQLLTLPGDGLAFSPDGAHLVTGGDPARLWDLATGQELLDLGPGYVPAFSPDGSLIAMATEEENWVSLRQATTGSELLVLKGHLGSVIEISFSPDGTRLATAGQDGRAMVWDTYTGEELLTLVGHPSAVNAVAFSPACVAPPDFPFDWCAVTLATAGEDGTIRMWDVSPAGSRELATLPGFSGSFTLDGTVLSTVSFVSSSAAIVDEWDASDESFRWMRSTRLEFPGDIIQGTNNLDNTRTAVITIGADGLAANLLDTSGEKIITFPIPGSVFDFTTKIALSPDGSRLALPLEPFDLQILDTATGQEIRSIQTGYTTPISAIAYSQDGVLLGTGSLDGNVGIWDAVTGKSLLNIPAHRDWVYEIEFSPDGEHLVTGSRDGTAKVWEVASGKQLLTLSGHAASVFDVSYNADGSRLATASIDGSAKVWNATTGEEMLSFPGQRGALTMVFFDPDGDSLATVNIENQTVSLYALRLEDLVALAQARLTRSLTVDECRQYLHQEQCP